MIIMQKHCIKIGGEKVKNLKFPLLTPFMSKTVIVT
jgi:hypothetical protein